MLKRIKPAPILLTCLMTDEFKPSTTRRQLLKVLAASSLADLAPRAGGAHPSPPHPNRHPAVEALDQLLRDKTNKVVIAYWDHDSRLEQNFNLKSGLLPMLHERGFTDNYVELAPSVQNFLDKSAKSYREALGQDSYYSLEAYTAARHNIKSTAVDVGFGAGNPVLGAKIGASDLSVGQYYDLLDRAWFGHIAKDHVDLSHMSIEQQIDNEAQYLRNYMKTNDGKYLKDLGQTLRTTATTTYAREDDQPTGEHVEELAEKAKGRVWMNYGAGHFTPAGLQNYIKDPLVLTIYPERVSFDVNHARSRNSDVFVSNHFGPAPVESYALLIKEGTVITVPKPDASKSALEEAHHLDRMVRQVLSSARAHP